MTSPLQDSQSYVALRRPCQRNVPEKEASTASLFAKNNRLMGEKSAFKRHLHVFSSGSCGKGGGGSDPQINNQRDHFHRNKLVRQRRRLSRVAVAISCSRLVTHSGPAPQSLVFPLVDGSIGSYNQASDLWHKSWRAAIRFFARQAQMPALLYLSCLDKDRETE